MDASKSNKSLTDNYDADYIQQVLITNSLVAETLDPNETFIETNLESAAEDLDDNCTSISQKPVNPLFIGNKSTVRPIPLPNASLVNDDRFWREQVNRPEEMADKVEQLQDQEIVTLGSANSSSPDSFTPNKKIKDRIPDAITRWRVSLLHGNLLLLGYDKDGKKSVGRICQRRISRHIFYDPNNIVCSLLGPSYPDTTVPKYILDKFKLGIPEDWHIIIQYWRHYKSLNCPTKYKWPPLPSSSSYDQTTNWYEIADTDTSYDGEPSYVSLTKQQLIKKIARLNRLLRATELREMSKRNISNSKLNLIQNTTVSTVQTPNNIDSISLGQAIHKNNVSRAIGTNLTASSSKTQTSSKNHASRILPSTGSFEMVSFHKKVSQMPVEDCTDSEDNLDSSLNKTNDCSSSDSESLHLLVSENSASKPQEKKKVNSELDIFSNSENKNKSAIKTYDSPSFVSLNSEASKGSSAKEKRSNQKVADLCSKSMSSILNSKDIISSKGRTRFNTQSSLQGCRVLPCNKSTPNLNDPYVFLVPLDVDSLKNNGKKKTWNKPIPTNIHPESSHISNNSEKSNKIAASTDDSEWFPETSNAETLRKRSRKTISNKTEPENLRLEPSNIETLKKRSRKIVSNKNEAESLHLESSKKSNKIVASTDDDERFPEPSNTETLSKRGRKTISNKNEAESLHLESSKKSNKIVASTDDDGRFPEPSNTETLTKRGRKTISNKNETENHRIESSERSNKVVASTDDADGFVKPPDIEIIRKRGRKSNSDKTETSYSRSKEVLKPPDKKLATKKNSMSQSQTSSTSRGLPQNASSFGDLNIWRNTDESYDSNISRSSLNSTVSSRGRIRVPSLPFWQGYRLKMDKEEIVIEQSVKLRCDIDSYVNNKGTNSTISGKSKSPKKTKPVQNDVSKSASSVLLSCENGYENNVLNKTTPKKSKQPVNEVHDSINNSINKYKEKLSNNSPVKKQINNVTKKSPNKNIPSPDRSSNVKRKSSLTENNIKTKTPKDKIKLELSSTKKNIPKQLKLTVEETTDNEIKINNSITPRVTRSTSKQKENEKLQNNKSLSLAEQLCEHLNLTVDQSPTRPKTRSVSKNKLFEDEPQINKQVHENNLGSIGTNIGSKINDARQKNKRIKIRRTSIVITTSECIGSPYNTRQSLNRNSDVIGNHKLETSKKYATRCQPKVAYKELNEGNKLVGRQQKITSSPTSKIKRPKKYTTPNNFNCTSENINQEENISSRNTNQESTILGIKHTTQFKIPKPKKHKNMVLPKDPNDLYLLVNKSQKTKKKEPKPEVLKAQEPIKKSDNCEPKKRKLFTNSDWMNSEKSLEHLSQNNSEEENYSNSRFVVTFNTKAMEQTYDDLISEVSAVT